LGIWLSIGLVGLAVAYLVVARLRREQPVLGTAEALAWTVFWISLALGFGVVVYAAYEQHWLGLGTGGPVTDGRTAALQYFTGYFIQKSLSIDNVFVIATIFAYFHVSLEQQQRLLDWSLLGAVALRALAVAGGIALVDAIWWTAYVFGVLLIFTALRMLVRRGKLRGARRTLPLRLLARRWPLHAEFEGGRFFVVREGRKVATPLLPALVMIASASLVFAIDAVPAIIAVTREPFIVLSAIVFALLGLHSMYFLLARLMQRLYYLRVALAAVLGFVGIKMLLVNHYPIATGITLAVVLCALAAGALAAALFEPPEDGRPASPLAAEIEQIVSLTLRSARRIVVLVTGSTVVIVGVLMIVTPGPAILVIPAGLAILATEFIWARRLLRRFQTGARTISGSALRMFRRRRNGEGED